MLTNEWIHISAGVSVLVIASILLTTIAVSALIGNRPAQNKVA
jgi:hypothetical protein